MEFPELEKDSGLTCGTLALFQICNNVRYSNAPRSVDDIKKLMNLMEGQRIDLLQTLGFLQEQLIDSKFIIKRNFFGKDTLEKNIDNLLLKDDLSSKKIRYLKELQFFNEMNLCHEVDVIDKKLIDSYLDDECILVIGLMAEDFSFGEFKGQHIVLIIGKDDNNNTYTFPGANKEFVRDKNLIINSMQKLKIKSFIVVRKNGNNR